MPKYISTRNLLNYWKLYLYVLPSALLVLVFAYYPCASAIKHSLYRWDASTTEKYIGTANLFKLLGWSPILWTALASWIFLVMATLTGKPAFAKNKAPYALVALSFLIGIIFYSAQSSGTEYILNIEPDLALKWYPRVWIATTIGIVIHLLFNARWSAVVRGLLIVYAMLFFFQRAMIDTTEFEGQTMWLGFGTTFILVCANVIKMIPSITTAVVIHRLKSERMQYIYRVLFVLPMIIPGMVYLLVWKYFFDPTLGPLNKILDFTGILDALAYVDTNLFEWGVFKAGEMPKWLATAELIIPSLIIWGFPWVGVVGVLIYLAGLQSISTDLYEAADIDGVGWFKKFLYIELPLIMTQVRINLILMIIGTLQGYAFILILLDDSGGPGGAGMVPGLQMFRNAFVEGYAGQACAVGLIIFIFILVLTEINNRYVRVEK